MHDPPALPLPARTGPRGERGQPGAAVEYGKFLEYWKDADPAQPELADARKRLAALEKGQPLPGQGQRADRSPL